MTNKIRTIQNYQMCSNVIAELNNEIAKEKLLALRIFNKGSLIISIHPSEYTGIRLTYNDETFNIIVMFPYLHILLFDKEYSHIQITESVN